MIQQLVLPLSPTTLYLLLTSVADENNPGTYISIYSISIYK
jgi:hypothetical protein